MATITRRPSIVPILMVAPLISACILLESAQAQTVDQTVAGTFLLLHDQRSTSRTVFLSKDRGITLPGGPDSPAVVGASLEITNPLTGESATSTCRLSGGG